MDEFIKKLIERLEEKQDIFLHDNSDYGEGKYNAYQEVIEIVNQLAEEYNNGWIPLLKQKPKYGQYVLASVSPKEDINGGHPVVIMEFREDNEPLFYRFASAWQPLPAPYSNSEILNNQKDPLIGESVAMDKDGNSIPYEGGWD